MMSLQVAVVAVVAVSTAAAMATALDAVGAAAAKDAQGVVVAVTDAVAAAVAVAAVAQIQEAGLYCWTLELQFSRSATFYRSTVLQVTCSRQANWHSLHFKGAVRRVISSKGINQCHVLPCFFILCCAKRHVCFGGRTGRVETAR